MKKVKVRTVRELYGGTEEEPIKACACAASLSLSLSLSLSVFLYDFCLCSLSVSGSWWGLMGHFWVELVGFIMWVSLGFTFQVVILMEFVL
jgi:hypothetical protein